MNTYSILIKINNKDVLFKTQNNSIIEAELKCNELIKVYNGDILEIIQMD
jgi:succinylarginine dihydrolase